MKKTTLADISKERNRSKIKFERIAMKVMLALILCAICSAQTNNATGGQISTTTVKDVQIAADFDHSQIVNVVPAPYFASTRDNHFQLLPNPSLTPGDAATTDAHEICSLASTKDIRHVTASQQRQVYRAYGTAPGKSVCAWQYHLSKKKKRVREGCEVDHLISLELGGSNSLKNLWPQPYTQHPGAHEKDKLENYLHRQICSGKMSVIEAQDAIKHDWTAAYWQMVNKTK